MALFVDHVMAIRLGGESEAAAVRPLLSGGRYGLPILIDQRHALGLLQACDEILDAQLGIESPASFPSPRIGCLRPSKTFAKVSA